MAGCVLSMCSLRLEGRVGDSDETVDPLSSQAVAMPAVGRGLRTTPRKLMGEVKELTAG